MYLICSRKLRIQRWAKRPCAQLYSVYTKGRKKRVCGINGKLRKLSRPRLRDLGVELVMVGAALQEVLQFNLNLAEQPYIAFEMHWTRILKHCSRRSLIFFGNTCSRKSLMGVTTSANLDQLVTQFL